MGQGNDNIEILFIQPGYIVIMIKIFSLLFLLIFSVSCYVIIIIGDIVTTVILFVLSVSCRNMFIAPHVSSCIQSE